MSILGKLASALGRNDEVPNQDLAKEIAESKNTAAVRELAENLTSTNKDIRSDCIKVLYEIGAIEPALIADHVDEFVALLLGRDNRLAWGGMTALGAMAHLKADKIWQHIEQVIQATEVGSVITQDWGIFRVLAAVSVANKTYEQRIFPFLIEFLKNCRPKDLPRHAESVLIAVNASNRGEILPLLEGRIASLKPPQAKRLEKVIKQIKALK